ncbi:MAG TPA: hypothetical protein VF954_04695, partial [Acidimicrobiales bacterium]
EHEGHLYVVRRTISGSAFTVRAQAFADGAHIAEGVRDTSRYVHSILGMDDAAFRASVFAEQKQIAAFSENAPADRRKLVLQLLGVTPLDGARDAARRDARAARDQVDRLRGLLPDAMEIEDAVADAQSRAAAADAGAAAARERADAARSELALAVERYEALDQLGRRHERLVQEGKACRDERDALAGRLDALRTELEELAGAAGRLERLRPLAATSAAAEARLRAIEGVLAAMAARDEIPMVPEPAPLDEAALSELRQASTEAAAALAAINGELAGARGELDRARIAAERSAALSVEGDCPLCGQALGESFAQVQAHRALELDESQVRTRSIEGRGSAAAKSAERARRAADDAERAARRAQAELAEWQLYAERRATAEAAVETALESFGAAVPDEQDRQRAVAALSEARRAGSDAARLEGRLTRQPVAEAELAVGQARVDALDHDLEELRGALKRLSFSPTELAGAKTALGAARSTAEDADRLQARSSGDLAAAIATLAGEGKRLEDARRQHDRLAGAEDEARHLGRAADLLNAFRNSVVATVGPRLSVQAAELFGELTDHEYDRLEVDADTYEIQIRDGGRLYGMDRFSGSETDLANLALRVAISEHVRFQSGGAVGLLVLDEVFGPLDEDRRERMLLAPERLRGRFRQVLVVTHASEIKDQLPAAVEVVKRPGRRATARLVGQ